MAQSPQLVQLFIWDTLDITEAETKNTFRNIQQRAKYSIKRNKYIHKDLQAQDKFFFVGSSKSSKIFIILTEGKARFAHGKSEILQVRKRGVLL